MGKAGSAVALAHSTDESILTSGNQVTFSYDSIEEAFPTCDPGIKPFGTVCIFQIRHPKRVTAGGILIPDDARSTEHYNTQVAKVIAIGSLAFKVIDKDTDEVRDWGLGEWFKVGDFVRLPKYGGDRFSVPFKYKGLEYDERGKSHPSEKTGECVFCLFKAKDVQGLITGDPLKVKAYLD